MSDTPKKKNPSKAPAKKTSTKSGTGKPGRPKKVATPPAEVKVKEETPIVAEPKPDPAPKVVVHANDVKKPSLRKRMLSWFK